MTGFHRWCISQFDVESGLNDGICVPLLLILLATTSAGAISVVCGRSATAFSAGPAAGPGFHQGIVVLAGRRNLIDNLAAGSFPLRKTIPAYGAADAG